MIRDVVVAIALLGATVAWAGVPTTVGHQGRLIDANGAPIDGTVSLDVSLWSAQTGGSRVWQETLTGVTVDNGYFAVTLGELEPLDDELVADEVWLQLTVDQGSPLARRQLSSTPYAILSRGVRGGVVDATEIRVDGQTVIDGDGTLPLTSLPAELQDGDDDTLASMACSDGQVPKWSGGVWACGDDVDTDTDTIVTWSTLDVPADLRDGDQVGLTAETDPSVNALGKAALSCAADQIPKYDGAAWRCVADVDTDTIVTWATLDVPADLRDGDQVGVVAEVDPSVNTLGKTALQCNAGETVKFDGDFWACAVDVVGTGDITEVKAGLGLSGGATTGVATLAVNPDVVQLRVQACPAGTAIVSVADTGAVTCEAIVPAGAVMFFDLQACPAGWSELTAARGRTLVGAASAGVGATVGTALANAGHLSITQVPAHTHTVDPPTTTSSSVGDHAHAVDPPSVTTSSTGDHSHNVNPDAVTSTSSGSHGHTVNPSSVTSSSDTHSHTYNDIYWSENGGPVTLGSPHPGSDEGQDNDNESYEFSRTTGSDTHTHTVDIPTTSTTTDGAHTHSVDVANTASTTAGAHSHTFDQGSFTSGSAGTHTHTTDIVSFSSGSTGVASVDVTMPYLQLLPCRRD